MSAHEGLSDDVSAIAQAAAIRSQIYALLAEGFTYPEGAAAMRLLDGDLSGEINAAVAALPIQAQLAPFRELPSGVDPIRETQRIHTDLFGTTTGSPPISMLERRYGNKPEQQLWEDLLRYYKHFGLDFSAGQAAEQADHLLTELAFMHYLCFLEAGAKGGQDSLQRGQRDFLKAHLGQWSTTFSAKLEDKSAGPYAALAQFLGKFVDSDLQLLDAGL